MAVVSTSAAGLLAQLDEPDDYLQLSALESLNAVVHEFWFQIASSIASVEAFYEDETFSHRKLAALLASKVFYYLGELDDALTYALGAGDSFDITEGSDYVNALLSTCVDKYITLRSADPGEQKPIDSRLEAIIERKFEQCFEEGSFAQAIGIALDARRLDKVEETIVRSSYSPALVEHVIETTRNVVVERAFREQALTILVRIAEAMPKKSWVKITQCFAFLGDASKVAHILATLLKGSEADTLIAYQACYDLFENEMQAFLLKVEDKLDDLIKIRNVDQANASTAPSASAAPSDPPAAPANGAADPAAPDSATRMEVDEEPTSTDPQASTAAEAKDAETGKETEGNGSREEAAEIPELTPEEKQLKDRLEKTKLIMRGNSSIQLHLDFLHRFNHADLQILTEIKARIEARNSVCHGAVVFANAIMHSGTTIDSFLRDNLDWLARATNWAKFGATAGLGVIHRGHLSEGKALMAPYLPSEGRQRGAYSEGGALFALGLIHANHGYDIREFLLESLTGSQNEVTQHGACLGLGLSALGTNDEDILEEIKSNLYLDNAVTGEAAGIAMGLVAAGSSSEKATELLAYAHETAHEKITRGVALGLALIMYGREEGADTQVEQMTRDQDPIIRYGGMQTLGMAYRGTANNGAIQKLLHYAVSDVSDDVRRAAVMNLGFVLLGSPEQCPKIVALLSESYNPHVRYGAAMAIGIACSNTGLKEALDVLKPLRNDTVDFVRQGAHIATALVLMLRPHPEVKAFRKELATVTVDKHEEVMARLGAIMATGILDAGGRNAVVGLRSQSGFYRRTSCIGMMVFTQYWFWYPLSYFFSLALQPSAVIAVNKDLNVPRMELLAHAKPSGWNYPPTIKQEDPNKAAKVPQAVLSTTRKVGAVRAAKKEALAKKAAAESGDVDMDKGEEAEKGQNGTKDANNASNQPENGAKELETKDSENASSGNADGQNAASSKDSKAKDTGGSTKEAEAEISIKEEARKLIHVLNPTRVPPQYIQTVFYDQNGRYLPADTRHSAYGIVVLQDTKPDEATILAGQEVKAEETAKTEEDKSATDNEGDALPPKPFVYRPPSSQTKQPPSNPGGAQG